MFELTADIIQKDIAGYVDVPVFMSSLLQVPFAQQLIGPDKVVGNGHAI